MKKVRGFTLIELLIVIAIIGILGTVISSHLGSGSTWAERIQRSGTLYKAGYTFSVDVNGTQQQMFDNEGHGIPCQQ